MFSGCTSLEYLEISNFDTSNIENLSNMFNGVNDIKYINLYYTKDISVLTAEISKSTNLNTKSNLTVCQKEEIINNKDAYYECCEYWYYNFTILRCDPDNYIKVKFKKDVSYPHGFSFVEYDKSENEYRTEVYSIH